MKFLTRSYVEWLGLELIPLQMPRNHGIVCGFAEHGTLPPPGRSTYCVGVKLGDSYYEREPDGLAFRRIPG